jgi:hypothetical protein
MDNNYMSLKFTARQLVMNSKRAEKAAAKEKMKLKKVFNTDNVIFTTHLPGNRARQYRRSSDLCPKCNKTKK